MNRTMNQTTITISVTNANQSSEYAIKKRVEHDALGRLRIVEHVRGIRL
jgi:hypothetical protein